MSSGTQDHLDAPPIGRFRDNPGRTAAPPVIVIAAGVCAALHVGKLPPAIGTLQEALDISLVQAGFLLSLVQLAGMVGGIAFGAWADSMGLRRSVIVGLSILALASAAGGLARTSELLLVSRAVEGFGFLLVVLPGPALLRHLVTPRRLDSMLGLWGAYMPFGAALGLLAWASMDRILGLATWWWCIAALSAVMAGAVATVVPASLGAHTPAGVPGWPARCARPCLGRTLAGGDNLRCVFGPMARGYRLPADDISARRRARRRYWRPHRDCRRSQHDREYCSRSSAAPRRAAGVVDRCRLRDNGRLLSSSLRGQRRRRAAGMGAILGRVWLLDGRRLIPAALFATAVRVAPNERTIATTIGWMQQWSALGQFAGPPLVAWVAMRAGDWQWTWVTTGAMCLEG